MPKDVEKNRGGGRRVAPRQAAFDNRLCISVTEAAYMLDISRNTAYGLVHQNLLPHIKLGKRFLIPKVALIKMLEEGVKQ
jgi:excisionase family DNA binding protein